MKILVVIILLALGGLANAQIIDLETALKESESFLSLKIKVDAQYQLIQQLIEQIKELSKKDTKPVYNYNWIYKNPLWQTISIQDLLDYEKECYNDSTVVDEAWIEWYDEDCPDCYVVKLVPKHYTHKHITFTGFIQYMKRKYGIK